jgi:hypothetical protein
MEGRRALEVCKVLSTVGAGLRCEERGRLFTRKVEGRGLEVGGTHGKRGGCKGNNASPVGRGGPKTETVP